MGFYPKHLKVQAQRRALRIIATAALAGYRFDALPPAMRWDGSKARMCFYHPNGTMDGFYTSRVRAAEMALSLMEETRWR